MMKTMRKRKTKKTPWQITPEMASLAATLPGRDLGVDCEAAHQLRLEQDWEYARQKEPRIPNQLRAPCNCLPRLKHNHERKYNMKIHDSSNCDKT
jgi:hypothetical protein